AEAIVEILVVEVEPGEREPRVLEHVTARAAALERESARLVLEQIAGVEVDRELRRVAHRTGRAARLVEPGGTVGEQPRVVGAARRRRIGPAAEDRAREHRK